MDITAAQQKLEQLGHHKEKKTPIGYLVIGSRCFTVLGPVGLEYGEDPDTVSICTNYGDSDIPLYVNETINVRGNWFFRTDFRLSEREVWVPK